MPTLLRLEVTEYTDRARWHWVLMDENGTFLAAHEVRLDRSAEQFDAFTDLQDYVSWHAPPDKRLAEESRIVTWIGDWIGAEVFGPAIGDALLQYAPAIVEVILPAGAETLAHRPLEVARFQGRSLAGHDITLVILPPAASGAVPETSKTDCLRVLGLFSLPEGGTALNLRHERQSLVTLINDIAGSGRSAEVKVLQYGVSQARLREILNDGEGWDIIHISGHGTPGELVLETADGRPDHISAADLADLLDAARDRVKLVTVSACWSAALATAEPRRQLGLPAQDQSRHSPERVTVPPPPQLPAPGDIATTLAARLGCAVLAMRFPVGDEFAIELTGKLYQLLVGEGQPLPRAVGLILRQFIESGHAFRFPALSMAAPAIFGASATDLTLKAPPRTSPVSTVTKNPKMGGFKDPQPERFVGRTRVMAKASAALAAESGISGLLLHGMPGGGKTACALELAYTHQDAFDKLIWFKAPDEGTAIHAALTDFALMLEHEVPGLAMIDKVVTEGTLAAVLPDLTRLMEQNRFLLVIDNAESLLTDTGHWHDERWGQVVKAMADHCGFGRLVITSQRVPAGMSAAQVESVDALNADEALLLARELPNLRSLIWGELTGIDKRLLRKLALGVLNTAQGHPKLLELADGQAANPGQLRKLLQSGGQAWSERGGPPADFFATGETSAAPSDYLSILTAWTGTVVDTLSSDQRDLFCFLCHVEERDRLLPVISSVWPYLWQRLGRGGESPELEQALTVIAASGLSAIREETERDDEFYSIHPGITAAGRHLAGSGFQTPVDVELARYWAATYQLASGETNGAVDTGLLVRAGLASVPYLARLERWKDAAALVRNALVLSPTRARAAALLPAAEHIVRNDSQQVPALTTALEIIDPVAAERHLRAFMCDADARGDYPAAALAAGDLIRLCLLSGRLTEALALTEQEANYIRQAGLGPWSRLTNEAHRLQVLSELGHSEQVLDDVQRLLSHMDTLPSKPGRDETVSVYPWHVREGLLGLGRDAATQLGRWQDSLDLNAAQTATMQDRRASAVSIAGSRFNDYGPLLKLGRTDDALTLLLGCLQTFHQARDVENLGITISALADVEDERGHGDAAIRLERDALRYKYLAGNSVAIAGSYHNLGNRLSTHAHQPSLALSCHLTAALIYSLAGTPTRTLSVREATTDLRELDDAPESPKDVADLSRRIDDIPGTNPADLIAKLSPDLATAEQTLQHLITEAQALALDSK